jgi:hypothetical protein
VEKDAVTVPIGQPTLTLDGANYRIEGSVDGLTLSNGTTTTNTIKATTWIETRDGDKITIGDPEPEPLENAAPTPDITDAAYCPDCKDDDPCGKHQKSIEPDVTDATVTLIQIDTDDSSSASDAASSDASAPQDGPGTNPDMGDEDYAASGEPVLTASLTGPAITRMVEMLESTTRELVEAKRIAHELTIEKDVLVRERDAAVTEKDRVLSETKRVLDQLADTPLMRRAVVANATRDLEERVKGVYSDDFLKMLRSPSNG